DCRRARGGGAVGGGERVAEPAGPRPAVPAGDVAGEEQEIAGAGPRNECGGGCDRIGQPDAESGEGVVGGRVHGLFFAILPSGNFFSKMLRRTPTPAPPATDTPGVHPPTAPSTRRTRVVQVDSADLGAPPCQLTLKLELLQRSGSFKTRG